MRDILFRGKSKETGKWLEGNLIHRTKFYGSSTDDYHIIYGGEFHCDFYDSEEVIPETVGQYTGLTDRNGKKIFEGDIVKQIDYGKKMALVEFSTKDVGSCGCCFEEFAGSGFMAKGVRMDCEVEIIGNIHDNPELLKGGEG